MTQSRFSTFNVGDTISFRKDGNELEGEIIKILGVNQAQVRAYGSVITADLEGATVLIPAFVQDELENDI